MTLDALLTLARVKELHALTRMRRAIATHATDPNWTYTLAAIDARVGELGALLEREDPQLVRDCEALLVDEQRTEKLTAQPTRDAIVVPPGQRIH